ncbi:MAG: type II secretion system minor pseudopilin GspJ [Allosphingosinicella sp.]
MNRAGASRRLVSGFTLVEMLLALTLFAMLTAAGVALLSVTARTQQTADRLLAELGELRAVEGLLTADLAQAVPRVHRDQAGRPQPAFSGADSGEPILLDLVRAGFDGEGDGASSLQRVQYRLRGDQLQRLAYRQVDGASSPAAMTVLRGIRQLRLRYRDDEGAWHSSWAPTDNTRLPRAVELVTDSRTHGLVRQLFLVGSSL